MKTAFQLPLNDATRARAFDLRKKLLEIWNSESGTGTMSATNFLSVIAMSDDQRAIIERAYSQPLAINCTVKPCTISGHGSKVTAATKMTVEGISNPYLKLASDVTAKLSFKGNDADTQSFTVCNMTGVSVQKFIAEFPVLAIDSKFQGTNASVTADIRKSSGAFVCN